MTVQISVTVWTIVCLLALMLILDRLLFRPLLSFMDRRREKIDRARAEKEQALRQREDELALRKAQKEAAERDALSRATAQLQALRQETLEESRRRTAEIARRLEEEQADLDRESQDIQRQLTDRIDEMSAAFAEGLEILVETGRADRAEAEVAAPHADIHLSNNH